MTEDELPDGTASMYEFGRAVQRGCSARRSWPSYADAVERGRLQEERGPFRWKRGKRRPLGPPCSAASPEF